MTCSICLEELKEENTFTLDDCKHIFHIKCIMKWFRDGHKTCPNCRSEPEPSSSSNDFYSRIFINSILSSLANDDRYQPQYQELVLGDIFDRINIFGTQQYNLTLG